MPVDNAAEPPNKRRKVGHSYTPDSSGRTGTSSIKQEPSPSPPPALSLRTSGTQRIALPQSFNKTKPGWKERRDKWVREETAKLQNLGLKITKRFIRDDGLAFDWTSPVPVNPLTLRVPQPEAELVNENPIPPASIPPAVTSTDPLGHALRDQSSLAGLRASGTRRDVPVHITPLKKPEIVVQSSVTENGSSAPANYAVVGAALLKKTHTLDPDLNADSEPVQPEHRKLLPADLRRPPASRGSKESLKDWKARRRQWAIKEKEKVEGYTGERSGGFKFDGDDVIIFLKAHHSSNGNSGQRDERRYPLSPSVIETQSEVANTNGDVGSVRSNPPPTLGLSGANVMERGAETTRRPNMRAMVGEENTQSSRGETGFDSTPDVQPQTTTTASVLREPANIDILDPTQARGLLFLEQYLQMFDTDRGKLGIAYTVNATFSLQTEEGYCNIQNASKVPSRSPLSNLIQVINTGPTEIVKTLQQLSIHLHHSPLSEIVYNIAALDDMAPGGLLLTCDGIMVHPLESEKTPKWSFSRTFVLQQNFEESRTFWPLKIVAERLTICSTSTPQN